MKLVSLIAAILWGGLPAHAQMIGSSVEITTTYSQNGRYYLKSLPFDNEAPSLPGKSYVFAKGNRTPLYTLERAFDSVVGDNSYLILSNDGEVIIYLIAWGANEKQEGLQSVNIYRRGRFLKGYSKDEITGCNEQKERCELVYSNFEQVVDKEKSRWGTSNYRRVFKAGVDEKERFLSDFAVFSNDDIVYLTDSKKRVHPFDLKEGRLLRSDSFDNLFAQLRDKGRLSQSESQSFQAPIYLDFPKLKNGSKAETSLAAWIGMKSVAMSDKEAEQFKQFSFSVSGYLAQNGNFEVVSLEADAALPKEKILAFFQSHRFVVNAIPSALEKWYLDDQYFYFRKLNDRIARQEKRQEQIQQRQEYARRLTLESINGVYMPKDLGESFIELDKTLKEVDSKEMQALPNRDEMIRYHHGLGMWLRNNWGLWGGSRLQKYFTDKGVTHPDDMSGIILWHYYDWLTGKRETWKEWEKNPGKR